MRVKMRTCIANAKVTAIAGSVIDVSEKEAAELIKGGYAEAVKEKKAEPVKTNIKSDDVVDFSKYTDDQLKEFAKKAKLPAAIKETKAIIEKLQEIKFVPEVA